MHWRGRTGGVSRGLSTLLCADGASPRALEQRLRAALPAAAQAALDGGLLDRLQVDAKMRVCMDSETRAALDRAPTVGDKHEAAVAMALISRRLSMMLKGHCDTCMYSRARCMCDAATRLRSRHTLWLFQNVGEYGRLNNSGRLLCLALGARLTTQGLRGEEDEMMRHAEQHRDSAVVLFPTPDAVTIDEYLEQRARRRGEPARDAPPLTIFLPDGTSNQAKNLERHLPAFLPRVRLNATAMRSWLDPIRRQTEQHRVCTAQAGAAVLAELGEDDVMRHMQNIVELFVKRTELDRVACQPKSA